MFILFKYFPSLFCFLMDFQTNVSYFVFYFTPSKHLFLSSREGQLTKLPETKKTLLFTFNGKGTVVCVSVGVLGFIDVSRMLRCGRLCDE